MADTQGWQYSFKHNKPHKKNAHKAPKKTFVFYYATVICTTTGGRTHISLCEPLWSIRLNCQFGTNLERMHKLQAQVCGCVLAPGRIQPVSLGGDFSKIWYSNIITGLLLQEKISIHHNTAVTKQRTAKWPYIANAVFWIVQNHGG